MNTLSLQTTARIFMRKNRKLNKTISQFSLGDLTQTIHNALLDVYNQMIRRLALVSLWLVLTPSLLLTLAVMLSASKNDVNLPQVTAPLDVSVNAEQNVIQAEVIGTKVDDPRPIIVERFLRGTPLEPHSEYIVEVSDKYGIDYRLIPAIAMKESGGGAAVDLASHNAWGFENGKTYFPSWEYAIDRVGSTLKNGYISKGLTTPEQIMAKYAPPQLETGGRWAKDINHFYSQMETL